MNKERLKELLPVMQAYIDGKQIQFKFGTSCVWENIENPSWDMAIEYRIAPEKKKLIRYINIYDDYSSNTHPSRHIADSNANMHRKACVRVEFEYEEGQYDK